MLKRLAAAALIALASLAAGQATARQDARGPAASLLQSWGWPARLIGKQWMMVQGAPKFYLAYSWDAQDDGVTFEGMDNDGHPIAGRYVRDSDTGRTIGWAVKDGVTWQLSLTPYSDGFEEDWLAESTTVRRRYQAAAGGAFDTSEEVYVQGVRKAARVGRLVPATDSMVAALGWLKRTPETEEATRKARADVLAASEGFGKRLKNAVENGAVEGVQEGVRDGVHDVTRKAIAGHDEGMAYPP